jgi:RNA polymerase sigma-70 factor (ECF subfamily)
MSGRLLKRFARAGTQEESLFAAARQDPACFADVYVAYHETVLGWFARRVFDPDTAFDLMAETFAAAFSALPSLRAQTEAEGLGWLWTIARHQLWKYRERGAVERRAREKLRIELPAMADVEYDRVEELADLDARRGEIAASLGSLPDEQRRAIQLRVIEDRSYEEMARMLAVSEQVVRARVSRGLRRLAVRLDHHELEEAAG